MAASAAAAVIGGAAALGFAGVANATPEEDAVIATMEAAGFHHSDRQAEIANAHLVCTEVGSGKAKEDVAFAMGMATHIGPDEAILFVDTAIANLCP